MNRILRALLASLFATVDAIRDHVDGTDATGTAMNGGIAASGIIPSDDTETELAAAAVTKKRRKRGRGRRSAVTYRLVKTAKGSALAKMLDVERTPLQPAEHAILTAIKANGSVTAFALEGLTGYGKKSVESAVWRLRKEHKLIESVPV